MGVPPTRSTCHHPCAVFQQPATPTSRRVRRHNATPPPSFVAPVPAPRVELHRERFLTCRLAHLAHQRFDGSMSCRPHGPRTPRPAPSSPSSPGSPAPLAHHHAPSSPAAPVSPAPLAHHPAPASPAPRASSPAQPTTATRCRGRDLRRATAQQRSFAPHSRHAARTRAIRTHAARTRATRAGCVSSPRLCALRAQAGADHPVAARPVAARPDATRAGCVSPPRPGVLRAQAGPDRATHDRVGSP